MTLHRTTTPAALTAVTTKPASSTHFRRWPLILEARIWRSLMRIGMWMHKLAPPRPSKPSFSLHIPSTLSPRSGNIRLVFYVPPEYERGSQQQWPVLVNFHGGGYTLGEPTDDARWAMALVQHAGVVCCSVAYRRAPEYPFPTAVEDGADALLYMLDHASELSLDADKLGVCGFSAGGNMALTATLLLQDALLRRAGGSETPEQAQKRHAAVKLVVSWYPPVDVTLTRDQRRASGSRPDKALPAFFTTLFDKSYLWPPGTVELDSPYLSPGVAADDLLQLLPHELVIYTCEWDQLWDEGEKFRKRMEGLGKRVRGRVICNVAHAWDKGPNPLRENRIAREAYLEACGEIRRVFNLTSAAESRDTISTNPTSVPATSTARLV
ncbi:alpha/beta-hydrolase [Exidia glandulosa HHB12029]|uniref:Alpha/beta-hydrolase n=1 Tax=Exidia glandulosa HHB12029 TaxID=1314781 RepID=A0A165NE43_EXIGL|nr:alpha/beta-hydrolase [Exidia glandulosa HHB12029]